MKLLFIANGEINKCLLNDFFNNFDKIICVDGGLNNLIKVNNKIIPDYIIGDFDSVNQVLFEKYKNKSIIIKKNNQDETDLLFSIKYFLNNFINIKQITILCGSSNRFDHILCNVLLLKIIPENIISNIISTNEEIFLLKKKLNIKNKLNKTISIIPITNVKNINCSGLKWKLNNVDLDFGFINGISNIVEDDNIEISISKGECLIIIINNTD